MKKLMLAVAFASTLLFAGPQCFAQTSETPTYISLPRLTPELTAPTNCTSGDFYYDSALGKMVLCGTVGLNVPGSVSVNSLNNVQFADRFVGADACAKIVSAGAALPSTGGTINALGIKGAQSCSANPFTSLPIHTTILLGNISLSTAITLQIPSYINVIGTESGNGNTGTRFIYTGTGDLFLISTAQFSSLKNIYIDFTGNTSATAKAFHFTGSAFNLNTYNTLENIVIQGNLVSGQTGFLFDGTNNPTIFNHFSNVRIITMNHPISIAANQTEGNVWLGLQINGFWVNDSDAAITAAGANDNFLGVRCSDSAVTNLNKYGIFFPAGSTGANIFVGVVDIGDSANTNSFLLGGTGGSQGYENTVIGSAIPPTKVGTANFVQYLGSGGNGGVGGLTIFGSGFPQILATHSSGTSGGIRITQTGIGSWDIIDTPTTDTLNIQFGGGAAGLSTTTSGIMSLFGSAAALAINGATSGSTTIKPSPVASGTLTLPSATDTLVARATTDTLNNKTLGTWGTQAAGTHINQSAVSQDLAGTISLTAATSASHTFAGAFASAPACIITPTSSLGTTAWWVTTTTLAVTANVSVASTVTFNYVCIGNPN